MRVLLCIDSEIYKDPSLADLDGNILQDGRISVANDATSAREIAKTLENTDEVYVVSSDDVCSINLAAAIKKDNFNLSCVLVARQITGSLQSRAQAANLTKVITTPSLNNSLCNFLKEVDEACAQAVNFEVEDANFDNDGAPFDQCERIIFDDSSKQVVDETNNVEPGRCWSVGFFGGSGGVGKSTISAISASLLSSLGFKVILIDGDLQFGDVSNFDKGALKIDIESIYRDPKSLSRLTLENISSEHSRLVILTPPSKIEMSDSVSKSFPEIFKCAQDLFDVIVFNTGSNWTDLHAHLMSDLDASIFLVDQRVSSLRTTKHALELADRLNLASRGFIFCVNKINKKSIFSGIDVASALDVEKVFELRDGGLSVEEELSSGNIQRLLKKKNALALSVFEMLKTISPLDGSPYEEGEMEPSFDKRCRKLRVIR
jgi:pilus assembly protein CpaE